MFARPGQPQHVGRIVAVISPEEEDRTGEYEVQAAFPSPNASQTQYVTFPASEVAAVTYVESTHAGQPVEPPVPAPGSQHDRFKSGAKRQATRETARVPPKAPLLPPGSEAHEPDLQQNWWTKTTKRPLLESPDSRGMPNRTRSERTGRDNGHGGSPDRRPLGTDSDS